MSRPDSDNDEIPDNIDPNPYGFDQLLISEFISDNGDGINDSFDILKLTPTQIIYYQFIIDLVLLFIVKGIIKTHGLLIKIINQYLREVIILP